MEDDAAVPHAGRFCSHKHPALTLGLAY